MEKTIVKLYRSESVDEAYYKRVHELEKKWNEDHPTWIGAKDLFVDIPWLREQGMEIEETSFTWIITANFPYEDAKKHMVILPKEGLTGDDAFHVFNTVQHVVARYKPDAYSLNKKRTGTISRPHWHLLFL